MFLNRYSKKVIQEYVEDQYLKLVNQILLQEFSKPLNRIE